MDVQDLEIYKEAMILGERMWTLVLSWDQFERNAIGVQLTRAADSVAANLNEGYGRYHFGENRQFCCYARGSLLETRTWIDKARFRGLIVPSGVDELLESVNLLGKRLNVYIRSIGRKRTTHDQ